MAVSNEQKSYLEQYHSKIKSGKIITSNKVKIQVEKLVKSMKAKKSKYYFDKKKADKYIRFVETFCKHSTGKHAGKPFLLELWQKAFMEALFGFYEKETGLRQYSEVFLVIARGNGKSTLASAISLAIFLIDGEMKCDIYTIATKSAQARIVFDECKRMIAQSPTLSKILKVRKSEILYDKTFSSFNVLASQSKSLDGLIPYLAILDEVGAMRDRNIYDIIKTAMSKRDGSNTLILMITTANFVRDGIYDERYEYASNVLNGTIDDDNFLPWIFDLDSFEEWKNFKMLIKANPNLGISKNIDRFKSEWKTAQIQPQQRESFLAKHCNLQVSSSTALFGYDVLMNKNNKNVDIEKYAFKKYCTVGVDLSQTMDLTAVVFLIPQTTGEFFVLPHFFIPLEKSKENEKSDGVTYALWERSGYITFTDGAAVNLEEVEDYIIKTLRKYNLVSWGIGYDRYYANNFAINLKNKGYEVMEVRQGLLTLSPVMKSIIPKFYDSKIIYNNNPILKWNLHNIGSKIDDKENILPIKIKSRKRIDGFMALLNAFKIFQDKEQQFKQFQKPPLES